MDNHLALPDLLANVRWVRRNTLSWINLLDEENLKWAPKPKAPPVYWHFNCIGIAQECYTQALLSGKVKFGIIDRKNSFFESKKELLAYFQRVTAKFEENINQVDLKRSFDWGNFQTGIFNLLSAMMNHETMHHGQLIVYSALAHFPIPKDFAEAYHIKFQWLKH